jgi:hypothetical protein
VSIRASGSGDHGPSVSDRKFLFSLLIQEGIFPRRPFCFGGGSIFPTPLSPLPRASLHPAAFRHQYTRSGRGCNPGSTRTSNVEGEGEEGRSPFLGRLTAVRISLGTGRGRNRPTAEATRRGVSRGLRVIRSRRKGTAAGRPRRRTGGGAPTTSGGLQARHCRVAGDRAARPPAGPRGRLRPCATPRVAFEYAP